MDGKVLDEKGVYNSHTSIIRGNRAKIVGISTLRSKIGGILLAPGSKIANLARARV